MPRYPDKVLIDEQRIAGAEALIESEQRIAASLADEVEGLNLFDATDGYISKLQALCAPLIEAKMAYHAGLQQINDEVNEIVSKHTPKE